jgi:magnesium transporter
LGGSSVRRHASDRSLSSRHSTLLTVTIPAVNPTVQLLLPEITELIDEGRYLELREALRGSPAADVGDLLAELPPDKAAVVFRFLVQDDAAEAFAYLPPEVQEQLIEKLGAEGSVRIVEAMDADDRVKLLDELPPEVAQRIIGSLSPENRRVTQAILGYPEKSVGRLMTPDYVKVRPEWTVAQALEHIRKTGRDAETVNVVYVVDEHDRLVDDLRLRQLLFADPGAAIDSLRDNQFIALRADQDQEEAVRTMSRYDRLALPVVDRRGSLLGIITADDVADVAEEETTEDIQKLGGMAALEFPYRRTGYVEMFKKRGSWLTVLFLGQTITIIVLFSFQKQLEAATVLAFFLPLVISCGGNSGSQAATLIIRALALEEIGVGDWWAIVRREAVTALMLAGTLGGLGLLCALFFNKAVFPFIGEAASDKPITLSITIAVAIVGVVMWGTLLGSVLPLLLRRLGVDPAAASSPMVATLMDASGTLIYLMLAVLILL